MTFTIYSQARGIPDPKKSQETEERVRTASPA